MRVLEYIQSESDRQTATLHETVGMVKAWEYLTQFVKAGTTPDIYTITQLSFFITGRGDFRSVPAVFNQGQPAIAPELIPNCMDQWRDWIERTKDDVAHPYPDSLLNAYLIEFLKIHPFADGNGRVASLLYNHFNGSIYDPVLLPYYFGEEPS